MPQGNRYDDKYLVVILLGKLAGTTRWMSQSNEACVDLPKFLTLGMTLIIPCRALRTCKCVALLKTYLLTFFLWTSPSCVPLSRLIAML